ncbi:hypothetical protein CIL05_06960 [Virgibacillus profundi]|uniref:Uncharacterized protein n=1 Tax=Virgibacillus profundi TaxID=2024555 RepID=A0A2A2IEP2_9BACI|nr:hypothetical protein [Virgibacillus profundi]PAV30199.1 hypothetical protein CIL05_06960 [Virgibacillus profundi]PXY54371.1 hypothetical protein CIT14_07045 [Virgibacillus profundi]
MNRLINLFNNRKDHYDALEVTPTMQELFMLGETINQNYKEAYDDYFKHYHKQIGNNKQPYTIYLWLDIKEGLTFEW